MIHQFFVPTDAAAILSILLSSRPPDDRLVWAFTSKGEFTVKGAYKVAMASANTDQSGEESNSQNRKLFWKSIWKLNVPNKIKSFARRANKNILPTKANLVRQNVIKNSTCKACGEEVESSGHVFFRQC